MALYMKRNERLPLRAREDRAPAAYREKKRASSKFMRKKKAPFTVDKKRPSFSRGQERDPDYPLYLSRGWKRAHAQEERMELPPSLQTDFCLVLPPALKKKRYVPHLIRTQQQEESPPQVIRGKRRRLISSRERLKTPRS